MTISGGGKLTIAENTPYYGYGIYCTGDLTLNDVTLAIDSAASGLWTQWKMDMTDCDITIITGMNGLVTNAGGTAPEGDKAAGQSLITVTGGTLHITANGGNSNAILIAGAEAAGALTVHSGDITLTAPYGILGLNDGAQRGHVTINGGSIGITATEAATNLPAGSITLNNNVAVTRGALSGTDCVIGRQYAVTVNGSYASAGGGGKYAEGTTVTIRAGSRSGYTFTGWTVGSGGVTLQDAGNATTTFSMPASAVAVTAGWTYNGGGMSGGYVPYSTVTAGADAQQAAAWSVGRDILAGADAER